MHSAEERDTPYSPKHTPFEQSQLQSHGAETQRLLFLLLAVSQELLLASSAEQVGANTTYPHPQFR
jgi:hypothetical protein